MRIEARASLVAMQGIRLAVETSDIAPERHVTATLYLLVTGCNIPGAVAALAAGCSKQNVSKILGRVEDRREDPAFDAALGKLERRMFGELLP